MALTEVQKQKIEEEEKLRSQITSYHSTEQKHGVPALLSFFIPGLGQVIKGQIGKGIGIFFGFLVSCVLSFTIIGIVVPIIVWVWQIVDAYNN